MPGLDLSIYKNMQQFEAPSLSDAMQKGMSLRQLGMQNQQMERDQAEKQHAQKMGAIGQALESVMSVKDPAQRAAVYSQHQQDLLSRGLISPDEAQEPYDDMKAQQALNHYKASSMYAGIDLERAKAQNLRAEAAAKAHERKRERVVPASEAVKIGGAESATQQLSDLEAMYGNADDITGPLDGQISKAAGYFQIGQRGSRAATLQKSSDVAAQAIGTYLEGGKLTDEDFKSKYKPLMPQLDDKPEVRANKVAQLKRLIAQRQQSDIKALGAAGYDVANISGLSAPGLVDTKKGQQRAEGVAYAQNLPKPGEARRGFVYMGGDPAKPESWKKAR